MNKSLIYLGMFVGSTIGAYVPLLFGIDVFSLTSIITSAVGGIVGIYLMYRLTQF